MKAVNILLMLLVVVALGIAGAHYLQWASDFTQDMFERTAILKATDYVHNQHGIEMITPSTLHKTEGRWVGDIQGKEHDYSGKEWTIVTGFYDYYLDPPINNTIRLRIYCLTCEWYGTVNCTDFTISEEAWYVHGGV